VLLITHYTRILRYVQPDFVHVFVGGRIVEEGGSELAEELETSGYERFVNSAGGMTSTTGYLAPPLRGTGAAADGDRRGRHRSGRTVPRRRMRSARLDVDVAVRADFPILTGRARRQPAGLPGLRRHRRRSRRQVLDAERDFYTTHNAAAHRGAHLLGEEATDAYEGARARVAAFLAPSRARSCSPRARPRQ
jgi:hypothetical protein